MSFTKFKSLLALSLFTALFYYNIIATADEPTNYKHLQSAVVKCESNISDTPYGRTGKTQGTGLILNAQEGIILTNAHIANGNYVAQYDVTLFAGQQLKAKLLYSDPQHDFAFLKVEPKELEGQNIATIEIDASLLHEYEAVFMLGNNEAQGFTVQEGSVATVYYAGNDFFSAQSYNISLNSTGGSSGSGIFDKNQKLRALNFAGSKTYAMALYIGYINDAYQMLLKGQKPKRQSIGTSFFYYSNNDAVRFDKMPQAYSAAYVEKYPNAHNKSIRVNVVMPDSDAYGKLQTGDMIVAINGKEIGPDLYQLHKIQNSATAPIKYSIMRSDKKMDVVIRPYNCNDYQIK